MEVLPFSIEPGSPLSFLFFLGFFLLVTGLLAMLSGWASLARRWKVQNNNNEGSKFRMRSGSMGWSFFPVSYGNCLTVTVSDEGLGLSLFFLFRLMSPPIFLPWSNIAKIETGQFLFWRYVKIYPENHWSIIKLYGGGLADEALAASRGKVRDA